MKTAKYKTYKTLPIPNVSEEPIGEVVVCQRCQGEYYRFLWKPYPAYCAHCGAKFEVIADENGRV